MKNYAKLFQKVQKEFTQSTFIYLTYNHALDFLGAKQNLTDLSPHSLCPSLTHFMFRIFGTLVRQTLLKQTHITAKINKNYTKNQPQIVSERSRFFFHILSQTALKISY